MSAEGVDFRNSREVQFRWLNEQGFEVVEYRKVTAETLDEAMDYFAEAVTTNDFPSDGLVALYDDIAYGESLGTTAKFPRNAMAFKWADEMRDTRLLEIEWSPSRTGLINPVAIFEPVELEGTTVSRASVHNISIMKETEAGDWRYHSCIQSKYDHPQIAKSEPEAVMHRSRIPARPADRNGSEERKRCGMSFLRQSGVPGQEKSNPLGFLQAGMP